MLSIRGQAVGSRLRAQCSASHSLQPCAEGWGGTTQLCASNQHCLGRGESSSTKAPHWYLGFLSPNINNMRLSEDLAVTLVQKSSPELLNSAASCMFLVSLLCLGLALRSVPAGSAEQTEALCRWSTVANWIWAVSPGNYQLSVELSAAPTHISQVWVEGSRFSDHHTACVWCFAFPAQGRVFPW